MVTLDINTEIYMKSQTVYFGDFPIAEEGTISGSPVEMFDFFEITQRPPISEQLTLSLGKLFGWKQKQIDLNKVFDSGFNITVHEHALFDGCKYSRDALEKLFINAGLDVGALNVVEGKTWHSLDRCTWSYRGLSGHVDVGSAPDAYDDPTFAFAVKFTVAQRDEFNDWVRKMASTLNHLVRSFEENKQAASQRPT